jgi:hypothetical protein
VVVVEVPGESLPQLRDLASHPAPGHVRENRGVAFPGDQGSHRHPAGDPEDRLSLATTDSLMQATSSSFSTRYFSAVRAPTRWIRYRVGSRNWRSGLGGTKLARSICRSATLHSQTASELPADMTRRNFRGAKTHVEDQESWRGSSLAMTRVLEMTRTKDPAHR